MGPMRRWSSRSSVSVRQIRPRPCFAMKLMASGVTFSAASIRSPSFSRSSSSTMTIMRPERTSSIAVGTSVNGGSDLMEELYQPSPEKEFTYSLILGWFHKAGRMPVQLCPWIEQPQGPENRGRNRRRRGNSQNPCPDDAPRYTPSNGGKPMHSAYSDNCTGDGVSGTHGNARRSCSKQCQCTCGFGAKPAKGLQLRDLRPHSVHNSPAAKVGASSDRAVRTDNDPEVKPPPIASHFGFGH